MRPSSAAVWFVVVTGSVSACSGDSFTPPPGGSSAGSAGTQASGAGTGGSGIGAGAKGGSDPGNGGTGGDAGTSSDAGSGGADTTAGAGGTNGEGGTNADGGSGGSEPSAGAGGKDGKGGQSGANAGGKGGASGKGGAGGAGGAAGNGDAGADGDGGKGGASSGGSSGNGGTTGVSGGGGADGCTRLPTCGDQKLGVAEACDVTACQDAYCSPKCQQTPKAKALRATELCLDGVCWMFVEDEWSSRAGAAGSCKNLTADARTWSLAWFTTDNEIKSLLVAAPQLLPAALKLRFAWIGPVYSSEKGWTQPDAPNGTPAPPLEEPVDGTSPLATKVQVQFGVAKITTSDPASVDGYVICRSNN